MIKRVEKGLRSGEKVGSKEDMLSERVIKGPKGVTYEKCNWKIKKGNWGVKEDIRKG